MDKLIIKAKKKLRLNAVLEYGKLFAPIGFKHSAYGYDGKNYIYIFINPKQILEEDKEYIYHSSSVSETGFYIIRISKSGPNQIGVSENGQIIATAPSVSEAYDRILYIEKIRRHKNDK